MASEEKHSAAIFIWGGACGIAGTLCYIIAILVPMSLSLTYTAIMLWPLLSVIFISALYRYIKLENDTHFNRLSFLMACIGFAIVAVMVSAQLAVRTGIEEFGRTSPLDKETVKFIKYSVRMVDMGIDVAWDCFIGTSLIFLFAAMKGHRHFGLLWGVPAGILAVILLVLNIITFPWPPADRGLFDIGPVIGLYIIILGARLLILGFRVRKNPV